MASKFFSWMGKCAKGVLLVVPPWVAFSDLGWTVRSVDGVSMQPTLNPSGKNEDFVLLDRWAAATMKVEKGDVVSLVSPKNPNQWLIKRVVALEGDEVKSHSCFEEKVIVPRGHCWVEGDNLDHSLDSNNFGPVSLGLITAKASKVIWPMKRWGPITPKDTAGDRVKESNTPVGRCFFGWDDLYNPTPELLNYTPDSSNDSINESINDSSNSSSNDSSNDSINDSSNESINDSSNSSSNDSSNDLKEL